MAYADEIIIDGQRLVLSGGSSLPASFGTSLTAFMTDIQALLSELAYTVQNNHAAAVSADADAVIAALGGGDTPVTTYSVTATLSHCTSNNSAASIARNASYIADLTADSGYSISSVTVTMGGTDITSTVYNSGSGRISIPYATGNIVITATATVPSVSYTIMKSLTHCASGNGASSVASGAQYATTLTADTGYTLGTVTVTMGGTDITSTAYNSATHEINIGSVTGNIVITATATVPVPSSVSAVFNGGDIVYENTPLNDLKQYMTVTATYSDSSTEMVAANDYTLSGTLTAGTCAITVTYQGQIDTVSVHVLESVTLPSGYTRLSYIVANQSYFDTGLGETQVDHAKYELAADVALMRLSNSEKWNANILGTNDSGCYYPCFSISSDNQYGLGFRYKGSGGDKLTNGTYLNYAFEDLTPYVIEGLPEIKINGTTVGTAKTGSSVPKETRKYRFCSPALTTTYARHYFYGRIYFFKAWDSSENLLAHYVPAKSSDNVVGLYDLVSNTFYSSAGTAFAEPTGV